MEEYESYTPDIPYIDDLNPQEPGLQPSDSSNDSKGKKPTKNERPKKRTAKKPTQKREKKERSIDASAFTDRMKTFFTAQNFRLILGMLAGGLGCWLLIAFISYLTNCISDQSLINNSEIGYAPPVGNSAGEGGARLSEFLINESFGIGSVVIVIWLLAMAMKLLIGWPRFKSVNFTIKCLVALITVSLIVGLVTIAADTPINWGGYHGRYVNEFIVSFIGWSGAGIVSLIMVGIFVLICLSDLVYWIIRLKKKHDARKRAEAAIREEQRRIEEELENMRRREAEDAARAGEGDDLTINTGSDLSDTPVTFETPAGSDGYTLPDLDEYYDTEAPIDHRPEPDQEPEAESIPEPTQEPTQEPTPEPFPVPSQPVLAEPSEPALPEPTPAPVEKPVEKPKPEREMISVPDILPEPAPEPEYKPAYQPDAYPMWDKEPVEEPVVESEPEEHKPVRPSQLRPIKAIDDVVPVPDVATEPIEIDPEVQPSSQMVVNVNQVAKAKNLDASKSSQFYRFPPLDLLKPGVDKISVDADEQMENKEQIRKTLLNFGIPIESIEATVGPTITLYEIRPGKGVKISKIRTLVDDIALSLSAIGVRIIAPIPGRGTVGIEVANKDPQTVSMRTVITSEKYQHSKAKLPVAIGSTISNDVYIADLTKMPHLLVAGATGQGKSVGLNAIITSLLYCKKPHELKFVMIDPKQVEFSLYSKIEKHYLAKIPDTDDAIITDMTQVVATLQSLCIEMDNRYQKLKQAQVRNLEEYNDKVLRGVLDSNEDHHFLPYIVLVVDEFADLIMTAGKDVEMPIARLAQKARAVGMHVIIATQRPSTNVITGIIKANFPVRIAFKVSSGIDSKTILDTPGAQLLIGRGDMLISNNSEMVRVQCAFIDTPEVEAICNHICREPGASGPYILPDPPTGGEGGDNGGPGGGDFGGGLDPLFEECARLVVLNNTASTSSLQRRYSIGYNRAGKIMDQLEKAGIVGPSTGGKPRNVLTDQIGLEAILEQYIH